MCIVNLFLYLNDASICEFQNDQFSIYTMSDLKNSEFFNASFKTH